MKYRYDNNGQHLPTGSINESAVCVYRCSSDDFESVFADGKLINIVYIKYKDGVGNPKTRYECSITTLYHHGNVICPAPPQTEHDMRCMFNYICAIEMGNIAFNLEVYSKLYVNIAAKIREIEKVLTE